MAINRTVIKNKAEEVKQRLDTANQPKRKLLIAQISKFRGESNSS